MREVVTTHALQKLIRDCEGLTSPSGPNTEHLKHRQEVKQHVHEQYSWSTGNSTLRLITKEVSLHGPMDGAIPIFMITSQLSLKADFSTGRYQIKMSPEF